MFDFISSLGAPVLIIVALAVVGIAMVTLRKVAKPNEALLISGKGSTKQSLQEGTSKFRVVTGGGAFYLPGYHVLTKLNLNQVKTTMQVQCHSSQGIELGVRGAVNFKIGNTEAEIRNAATRFLGQQETMVDQVQGIFAGHLRAIVGNMTVEELLKDRDVLRAKIREASEDEMGQMGIKIDSMQILDFDDPTGYIADYAAPFQAAVKSTARIAEAQKNKEATEKEQEASIAVAQAETSAAKRRSELKAEADKAARTAEQAGPLAEAQAKQEVVVAETRAAELRAALTEKNLETEVRRPADARAYETKVSAEAERDAAVAAAQAEAQRTTLQAQAEADAARIRGEAAAAATRATGEAEAEVVKAKGLAEAEAMNARAEALLKGQDGLIAQQVAERLPEIVAALVAPFGNIDKLTVLNGAEGMSQMVVGALGQLEGVLPSLLNGLGTKKASNELASQNGSKPEKVAVDA